jgi:DNA-binding HxlR family transcriptional regulator
MGEDTDSAAGLSPDEAFAVLGDETRLTILRTLGNAAGPLAFSELYDRSECDTSANFSYHLDKLADHFVRRTESGYELRQTGQRVVEAVLSGAVTDAPELEPTRIDMVCPFCGSQTAVGYHQERVNIYCTNCSGLFGDVASIPELPGPAEYGYLGFMPLPPAGVQGRTAAEILAAGWAWGHLDYIARGGGICPRCSAAVEQSMTVCEDHEYSEGACDSCGRQYAAYIRAECVNCINSMQGIVPGVLLGTTELQAFLAGHGVNIVAPDAIGRAIRVVGNYDEEVVSTDPFEVRFTFTAGEEALTVTIDEELEVVDATVSLVSESTS